MKSSERRVGQPPGEANIPLYAERAGTLPELLLVRGRGVDVFTRAMERRVALQPEEGQESCCREWHVRGPAVQRKDLGQYVEQRNGHYGAGTEPEQEVKAIAKP